MGGLGLEEQAGKLRAPPLSLSLSSKSLFLFPLSSLASHFLRPSLFLSLSLVTSTPTSNLPSLYFLSIFFYSLLCSLFSLSSHVSRFSSPRVFSRSSLLSLPSLSPLSSLSSFFSSPLLSFSQPAPAKSVLLFSPMCVLLLPLKTQ